jgi:hypothetical protein
LAFLSNIGTLVRTESGVAQGAGLGVHSDTSPCQLCSVPSAATIPIVPRIDRTYIQMLPHSGSVRSASSGA